ncbi:MAG: hypothetical protein G01um10145_485 [Microgenomates group bacterium Gr01-1014_5]|nr:MAG: hypothetical protein G01um10145_485 [Microgenomates group bacterium Gr01-1014_5]
MPKTKGTPLTLEMFVESLLPRTEEMFEEKFSKYRDEVLGFKQEVLGEIEKLREESSVSAYQ